MAAKKSTGKRSTSSEPSLKQQAEQLQQKLGESAQLIWLAGVGAFGRAQNEGSRLFDTLVKEGSRVEQQAGTRAARLRHALDGGLHGTRQRASEAFGRIDQALRGKVKDTLKSLEVPTRRELSVLIDKVATVNAQLRKHNDQSAPAATKARKSVAKKSTARKTPTSTPPAAARKTATKKTAPSKATKTVATKKTARKSVRRPAVGK